MSTDEPAPSDIPSLTLEVLKDIRGEMRETRHEIVEMRGEIVEMKSEIVEMKGDVRGLRNDLRTLEEATIAGFMGVRRELDRLGQRVDHLRDVSGESWRGQQERLGDLEIRVRRLEDER